jgi:DNA repair exonuclease SbcCD nuclease subunit
MPRILHTADVHLDAPFYFMGPNGKEHRRQIRTTFAQIARLAAEDHYDLLLIVGDLFDDEGPSRDTQHFVMDTLGKLPLPVCILPGNHDYLHKNSFYYRSKLPENIYLFREHPSRVSFPDLDLTVAGNPHLSRYDRDSQLKGIVHDGATRWFVAMAHGNVQGSGSFEVTSRPIEPASIGATGANYVALGDWHAYADYSQQGVRACYSGAPEPTKMSDFNTGKVVSITLSDQGVTVEPKHIGSIEARVVEFDVSSCHESDIVAKIQAEANNKRMVTVKLIGLKSATNLLSIEAIHSATADNF